MLWVVGRRDADRLLCPLADINRRYRAHRSFGDRRDDVISARTYFYKDESHCDENMQNFITGIDAVSGNDGQVQ